MPTTVSGEICATQRSLNRRKNMLEPDILASQAECLTVAQMRRLLDEQPDDAVMLLKTADGRLFPVTSVTRQLLAETNPPTALAASDVECSGNAHDFCCDTHRREWEQSREDEVRGNACVGICLGEAPGAADLED